MTRMAEPPPREPNLEHALEKKTRQHLNALFLAEIILSIGRFLNPCSLCNCLRVCQAWHQVLLPLNWFNVEVHGKRESPLTGVTYPYPGFLQLTKHAPLIRQLDIKPPYYGLWRVLGSGPDPEYATENLNQHSPPPHPPALVCPNLTWFRVSLQRPPDEVEILSLQRMLQRHESFLTSVYYDGRITESILETLKGCAHLKTLRIQNMGLVPIEVWIDLYGLWSRLDALYFGVWQPLQGAGQSNNNYDEEVLARLKNAPETKLKFLQPISTEKAGLAAIALVNRMQQLLILKSPSLVRLTWYGNDYYPSSQIDLLVENVVDQYGQRFQQLESLALRTSKKIENVRFKILLGAMPVLKELNLDESGFDLGSWKVLQDDHPRLLTRLTLLNVESCRQLPGAAVQEMLCSMTGLQEFRAPLVRGVDIENDNRPWVCLGITHLELCFVPGAEDDFLVEKRKRVRSEKVQRRQLEILDRLSTLVRLEYLNLTQNQSDEVAWASGGPFCLLLNLDHGLAKLSSLRRLRRLEGPWRDLGHWGRAEAEWVLSHWRQLEYLDEIYVDSEAYDLMIPHFYVCN